MTISVGTVFAGINTIETLLGNSTSSDTTAIFAQNSVPVTNNGVPVYSQNSLNRPNPQPLMTFPQYLQRARPVKLLVRQTLRPMEHPLETGAIITDHVIILPNEIEIEFIAQQKDYISVYQEMRQLWQSATLMRVNTRATSYQNMLIAEMPHEETVERFNAITFRVRFKQVLFANTVTATSTQTSVYAPADPTQVPVVQQGQVTAQPLPTPVTNSNGVVADPLSSSGFSQFIPGPLTSFIPGANSTPPLPLSQVSALLPTIPTASLDTVKNLPGFGKLSAALGGP